MPASNKGRQPADTPPSGRAARADPAADEGSSRRNWERSSFPRDVRVCELDDDGVPGAEWACRAADISRGGIGLRSRRMVHEGRKIFIRVPTGPDGAEKLLFGVVRQSRYQQGEGFVIGVRFEEIPRTWAVTRWLDAGGSRDAA